MSHVVEIQTTVRDLAALEAACRRLRLERPVLQTVRLFNAEVTGHCVQLPGWRYPVACDLATGALHFDDFEERWGKRQELHRLLQIYAVERATLEARRQGYRATEQALEDGSIKLTVDVGGGR